MSVCVSVTAIFARELITAVQVYSINGFSMIWFLPGGFRLFEKLLRYLTLGST